jgi:hypothetical protein
MTRGASTARRRKHATPEIVRGAPDSAIYGGLILIGLFVALLAIPLFQGHWREALLAYLVLMAALINFYAWRSYRSQHLAHWQKALARLPLRFAGYGTRGGKPLEAAHGQPAVRRAIVISIVVCIVVLVVLAIVMVPAIRASVS